MTPARPMTADRKAISVAILAMGGEGGGVLADWLVDLAETYGYYAQATSVPGVAQRTGATIYYVEMFPESAPGRTPVLALMPFAGDVDLVIASELMEAGRAVQRGLVTAERTTLVASTHRVYSMTEKTAPGDGRIDGTALLEACRAAALRFVGADFARAAEAAGSLVSAALFGAVAASGALPFPREAFEGAVRRAGLGVDASLAAFAEGARLAASPARAPAAANDVPRRAVGPLLKPLVARIEQAFPRGAHDTLVAGIERLADYQDVAYADAYLDRLAAFAARAGTDADGRLLATVGQHLALWMSYEDTIRVADLKTRRTRFERVRTEVRASPGQIVAISEFVHPRVEEIADTLPAPLGRWLLRTAWARALAARLTGRGRRIRTTSLRGYLLLYAVAGLRPFRRSTLRFRTEQARIDAWLRAVQDAARHGTEFAIAVAECQRLVKGYGDTHERGLRKFGAVMGEVPALGGRPDGAARLRRLRDAALADEDGRALAEAQAAMSRTPQTAGTAPSR